MSVHEGGLGRVIPPDWQHVETHHVNQLAVKPKHMPVVLGIAWYQNFDRPVKGTDGKYRIGKGNLGSIRGYHAICCEPAPDPAVAGKEQDVATWHMFFDQGETPACEGFSHARAMTLIYREKFNPFWLYDDARRKEGTYPDGEGSTNRETCAALQSWGVHPESGEHAIPQPWSSHAGGHKIASYHWMTTVDEVCAVLGLPAGSEVPLLQSWGVNYPERVYLDPHALATVLGEEGEADCYVLS